MASECFVSKTRFDNFVYPALEYIPSSSAVEVFGLFADLNCFASKSVDSGVKK